MKPGWGLVLPLLSFLAVSSSHQSLTELAKKEEERRKQLDEDGRSAEVVGTNVILRGEGEEVEVPRFETVGEYEGELDRTFEELREVCEEWKQTAIECQVETTTLAQMHRRVCAGPAMEEWRTFTRTEYRVYVVSEWRSECRERFEATTESYRHIVREYDALYRDYVRLAGEQEKLAGVRPRKLPKPK
jgi:hypothetical protein